MMNTTSQDGRTRRLEAGRLQVVHALVALVEETGAMPDVAALAVRAGVGRRSVFRYFDGPHALAMAAARDLREQAQRVLPLPPPVGGLEARLTSLLDHRAALHELGTPLRRFLTAASPGDEVEAFLEEERAALRRHLKRMLAKELVAHPARVVVLELATGWEAWDSLRRVQRCSAARARREMESLVRAILGVAAQR